MTRDHQSSYSSARQVLRAAAPPLLTLGVLLVIGELALLDAWTTTFDTTRLVAAVLAGVWLVIAIAMAGHRVKRDSHAHQRLQELRDDTQAPGRALVHVQTLVSVSAAGQYAVVVNIATGYRYRLWLPEVHLPIGAYAVVEQRVVGVAVIDWVGQRTVDAAHRHERRHPERRDSGHQVRAAVADPADRDDARRLIEETEQFLKEQESI